MNSPVAVVITEAQGCKGAVTIETYRSIVIVDRSNVPSTITPTAVITLPTNIVVTVPISSWVTVPDTIWVPNTWTQPVAAPRTWFTNVPTTDFVVVPNSPDVIVISYTRVPEYVPTGVLRTVPWTNVVDQPIFNIPTKVQPLPVSIVQNCVDVLPTRVLPTNAYVTPLLSFTPTFGTWTPAVVPSTVYVPYTWTSPVIVPVTDVRFLPPTDIIILRDSPTKVVVSREDVPAWVPWTRVSPLQTSVIVTGNVWDNLPTTVPTIVQTHIADRCVAFLE
jgi:hypothetical protein